MTHYTSCYALPHAVTINFRSFQWAARVTDHPMSLANDPASTFAKLLIGSWNSTYGSLTENFFLDERLTADIDGALDRDQDADAGVGTDVCRLAFAQPREDGVVDRPVFVHLGGPVKA